MSLGVATVTRSMRSSRLISFSSISCQLPYARSMSTPKLRAYFRPFSGRWSKAPAVNLNNPSACAPNRCAGPIWLPSPPPTIAQFNFAISLSLFKTKAFQIFSIFSSITKWVWVKHRVTILFYSAPAFIF